MASPHAPSHHPASPADAISPTSWLWTSIFDPTVHTALRPLFTRALFGDDDDCSELLEAFCSPGMEAVIVKDQPCAHCAVLGRTCIAAAKPVGMWPTRLWAHATRCIACVLHGQTCDLPVETRLLTCTCHWMVPARDRAILNSYVRLHFFRVSELSFPIAHRSHPRILALLINKLQAYREWFNEHAEMGYEMHLHDLLPALQALGTSSISRDDGKWIVEARARWEPCPCYPTECDGGVHPLDEGCCGWDEFDVLDDELLGFAEGDATVASGISMFEESPARERGRDREAVAARRLSVLDRLDGWAAGDMRGGGRDRGGTGGGEGFCLDVNSPENADRGQLRSVSF